MDGSDFHEWSVPKAKPPSRRNDRGACVTSAAALGSQLLGTANRRHKAAPPADGNDLLGEHGGVAGLAASREGPLDALRQIVGPLPRGSAGGLVLGQHQIEIVTAFGRKLDQVVRIVVDDHVAHGQPGRLFVPILLGEDEVAGRQLPILPPLLHRTGGKVAGVGDHGEAIAAPDQPGERFAEPVHGLGVAMEVVRLEEGRLGLFVVRLGEDLGVLAGRRRRKLPADQMLAEGLRRDDDPGSALGQAMQAAQRVDCGATHIEANQTHEVPREVYGFG